MHIDLTLLRLFLLFSTYLVVLIFVHHTKMISSVTFTFKILLGPFIFLSLSLTLFLFHSLFFTSFLNYSFIYSSFSLSISHPSLLPLLTSPLLLISAESASERGYQLLTEQYTTAWEEANKNRLFLPTRGEGGKGLYGVCENKNEVPYNFPFFALMFTLPTF